MQHGGDIFRNKIKCDFSISVNPYAYKIDGLLQGKLLEAIKHYPDIECEGLREALAKRYNIAKEYIICANGASELILGVARALKPRKALLVSPTFSGYEYALNNCEIIKFLTAKNNGFRIDEQILNSITKEIDILFLGSVENPTGYRIENELLDAILEKAYSCEATVVLDDSFYELSYGYVRNNINTYIKKYNNLIIINSFTKTYGYPGIRLGFSFSNNQEYLKKIIAELSEWNVSSLAQLYGQLIASDCKHLEGSVKLLSEEKVWLEKKLSRLGVKYLKSDVNFMLIYSENDLYKELLDREILIKAFDNKALENYYRIAVRSRADNEILIDNLKEILAI